jgi:glycosyltransferase involved in cell wall biosynthesis
LRRLLLLTPAELTRDPRARRAAIAARGHGLDVLGVCGRVSGEEPVPLDGVAVIRVGPRGATDPLREGGRAIPGRSLLGRELVGLFRIARLALRTVRLWRAGRRVAGVAIVHAHDLDTLPAGWLVARRRRARLVYDAHELYSSFEPDPPRLYRTVMLALEGALARRADAVVTVNEPIARELQTMLGLEQRPLVVLNVPTLEPENSRAPSAGMLRAIYQGAFGPGRPLDELLAAVHEATNVHLTLRVVRIPAETLRAEVERWGLEGRVAIEQPLPPDRLIQGLRGRDVGVIFDRPHTRNSELSLPNKFFEYLMAGLAVVAPRLPALAERVEADGVGLTYTPGRPDELGTALERLAADRSLLEAMRRRARDLAVERYNAQAQEPALLAAWGLPGTIPS